MSLMMKHQFVCWLSRFNWLWFGTLTFRAGIRRKSSERLFRNWIEALQSIEGRKLSWMRVAERGGEGGPDGNFHFHVLIAGTGRRFTSQQAADLWKKMAGTAVIGPYDRQRRGLEYALKSIEDRPDYDFDATLLNEHLRKRVSTRSQK